MPERNGRALKHGKIGGDLVRGRLLVAYGNSSNYVTTTAEYLDALLHSGFDVRYVHVTHGARLDFDINDFDVLFQSYCARMPFVNFETAEYYVSPDYQAKLKQFRGIKLLAVQDEYDRTNNLREAITAFQFDCVFTAVPDDGQEFVYPKAMFPRTEFINVLTGYVPQALETFPRTPHPLAERPIIIGYRGREIPAYYGRLGFEKAEIGRRMKAECERRGIPHDIDITEQSRLYGEAWYEFLSRCRTTLGSESGSNIFDFDGSIGEHYRRVANERGAAPTFEQYRIHTDPLENKISMGQISPRVFEAAALRTPLILHTGHYSGLITPDEHYIELKKDFSNLDSVLARLDDLEGLERMADRTYDRLIRPGNYSYRQFGKLVGDAARRIAERRQVRLREPLNRLYAADVFNPSRLTFEVYPTPGQRHPAIFWCSLLARENSRLNAAVIQLQQLRQLEDIPILRLIWRKLLRKLPDRLSRRLQHAALWLKAQS